MTPEEFATAAVLRWSEGARNNAKFAHPLQHLVIAVTEDYGLAMAHDLSFIGEPGMQIFTLLMKLAADIRAKNGQALGDIIQLFSLIFGFAPTPPVPNPTPPIAPGALASAQPKMAVNHEALASEIEDFCNEHQNKVGALGDGTFLKALMALLMKLLPLIIGG